MLDRSTAAWVRGQVIPCVTPQNVGDFNCVEIPPSENTACTGGMDVEDAEGREELRGEELVFPRTHGRGVEAVRPVHFVLRDGWLGAEELFDALRGQLHR